MEHDPYENLQVGDVAYQVQEALVDGAPEYSIREVQVKRKITDPEKYTPGKSAPMLQLTGGHFGEVHLTSEAAYAELLRRMRARRETLLKEARKLDTEILGLSRHRTPGVFEELETPMDIQDSEVLAIGDTVFGVWFKDSGEDTRVQRGEITGVEANPPDAPGCKFMYQIGHKEWFRDTEVFLGLRAAKEYLREKIQNRYTSALEKIENLGL